MKNRNTLQPRLTAYASSVIALCESLPSGFTNTHLSKQLIRSASSSALNYAESLAAESTADFIHKLSLVLKELRESMVSMQLLRGRFTDEGNAYSVVLRENDELIAILVTCIKKLKEMR